MMQEVTQEIHSILQDINDQSIITLIKNINTGKMLRSKLVLAITGKNKDSIKLCAIVEMIHLASLLHDDVIDNANTRRGEPSINDIYGNKNAIMIGDILYSLAFSNLDYFDKKIIKSISKSVMTISVGEFLDVSLSENINLDEEKYIDMLYKKTSALIQSASFCASFLANKECEAFSQYGKYLGICFQLTDDLLDLTQESETLGKPAMSDFAEGKTTIPYILLFKELDDKDSKKLKSLYKKNLDNEEILWIKEKISTHNIKEKSLEYINKYASKALEYLPNNEEKLKQILNNSIQRFY